jgi:hypothetical protein
MHNHRRMPKALRETQVVIRISAPLRDELTVAALEEGRTLAGFVRRQMVDLCARRMTEGRKSDEAVSN